MMSQDTTEKRTHMSVVSIEDLVPERHLLRLIDKAISVMTYHMAQMSLNSFSPDVLIEVSRNSCGTYDFFKAGEMVEMGKAATIKALEKQ